MKVRSLLLGSAITLVLVLVLVVGCVGGIVVAPYVQQRLGTLNLVTAAPVSSSSTRALVAPTVAPQLIPAPTATSVPLPADASAEEQVASDVYRKVSPAVVYISVVQNGSTAGNVPQPNIPGFPQIPSQPNVPQAASGSGFVLDKDGHIVTNNHVIEGADKIEVKFIDGTMVHATVVGADPYSDLAVIKVDVKSSLLQPVELGDSSALIVGQQAFAIGNPFGQQWTLTSGIVSAVGRTIQSGASRYSIPEAIQTDAAINPGNSGGPLLDRHGRVIGINTQIISESRSSSGVGFAVPVNIVKLVVPTLIKNGHYNYAWLGIEGTTLTLDLAEAMNLSGEQRGALITGVTRGGPADKAGIIASQRPATIDGTQVNVGGDIVIAIDRQPVTGIDSIIDYLVNAKRPGDTVTLTVLRDGQQKDIQITLGERPQS